MSNNPNSLRGSFLNNNGQKTTQIPTSTFSVPSSQPIGSNPISTYTTYQPITTTSYMGTTTNPSIYSSYSSTTTPGFTTANPVPSSYLSSFGTATGTATAGLTTSSLSQQQTTTTYTNLATQFQIPQSQITPVQGTNTATTITTTTTGYSVPATQTLSYDSAYIQEILNRSKQSVSDGQQKMQDLANSTTTNQVQLVPGSGLTTSQNNENLQTSSITSSNLYSSNIANPIYTNNLTTSTNYDKFSPVKQSTTFTTASQVAPGINYRVEVKAQMKYLSHVKEEMLQKQQEYQKDISGLLTGMKREMEAEFEKTLDHVHNSQNESNQKSLVLQKEVETLTEKLFMSTQINDVQQVKIKNLEQALDKVNEENIKLQSSNLDLDQVKTELSVIKTENEALRQSQTSGSESLTQEIKLLEQQYLQEKDKNHHLVAAHSEEILKLNHHISELEDQIVHIQKELNEKSIQVQQLQKEKEIILVEKNTISQSLVEKETIIEKEKKEIVHISSVNESEVHSLREQISKLQSEIRLNSEGQQNDFTALIEALKRDIEEKDQQLKQLREFVMEVQHAGQIKVLEREQQLLEKDKIIESQKEELMLLSSKLEQVIREKTFTVSGEIGHVTESVRIDVKSQNKERQETEVKQQVQEIPIEGEEEEEAGVEEVEFDMEVKQAKETRQEGDKQGFFDQASSLSKELMENKQVQDNLLKEKDGLSKKVTELNVKYLDAEKQNNEKIAQYQKQEAELKQQIQKLQQNVDELTKQIQSQKEQLQQDADAKLVNETNKIKQGHQAKVIYLNAEIAALKEKLNEEKTQSEQRVSQVLQSQNSSSSELITKHELRVTELQNNFNLQRNDLETKIVDLQHQLAALEQKLRDEKSNHEALINQNIASNKSSLDEQARGYELKLAEQQKSYELKITEINSKHQQASQEVEINYKKQITELQAQSQLNLKLFEERETTTKQLEQNHSQAIQNIKDTHLSEINNLKNQFSADQAKLQQENKAVITQLKAQIQNLEIQINELNQNHSIQIQNLNKDHQAKLTQVEVQYKQTISTIEESHKTYISSIQENHKKEISLAEEASKKQLNASEQQKLETIENQYKQRINNLESEHKLQIEQLEKQHTQKVSNLEKDFQSKIDETIKSYNIKIQEIEKNYSQKIAIVISEKEELSAQNSAASKGQQDKEAQLQKEISELKLKIETLVNNHQKEIIKQEEKYNLLRQTVQQISQNSQNVSVTSNIQSSSSSSTVNNGDYLVLQHDYNQLIEVNKENLKKIQEERRLYGILQDDYIKLEQQFTTLKNEKKNSDKKSKTAESNTAATTTSGASQLKNKAYFEVDQRVSKELELTVLKLKEENAIIRDQLKKEYEDKIYSLEKQAIEYEKKMIELEQVKVELKAMKDEKEEADWEKARKNNGNKGASKEEQAKKTGLEKEKEELQKVLEKKNEEIRKLKNDYKKLEKQLKNLQAKSPQVTPAPATVESQPTLNTEEAETKKGKKKGYKIDDDLQKIFKLSDIIYQINQI
ncbi:hypothetical protein TTHERM_00335640 (macronuclear) [Tetrahymena thermophila SB210]|uniref:Uncharacterized protein n=1 Tax=Tetrahymena thermophila (strain SB210) TaxID=312017 RepID=I7LV62_TETTS|nr:hypothetical protein TTHERM_00335640 [Tetrahymena thermophila SB210]EAR97287.1 hypothetical protein TTHERM_00335640 [Tetrahymena thermophila SB210]|eukprot:XP_001017532.1 hypothetical protein TTHERM_00335640 [Tetrahymena thermophila SB210]